MGKTVEVALSQPKEPLTAHVIAKWRDGVYVEKVGRFTAMYRHLVGALDLARPLVGVAGSRAAHSYQRVPPPPHPG